MIRGAAAAGLLPEQPLLARLDASVEAASAAFLGALDDSENPTAQVYLQKAAQAADEAWQQRVQGHNGPTITNPTIPHVEQTGFTSQHDDDAEPTLAPPRRGRLSAPQLQAQLSRLSDRTRLRRSKRTLLAKGARQQVMRPEDVCHTHVSQKWLYHLDVCKQCPNTGRYHQRAEKIGQSEPHRHRRMPSVWIILRRSARARRKPAALPKPPRGALCMRSRRLRKTKTRGPRNHHGIQRTHRNTIQTGSYFHYRCCPRTQCGSGRVWHLSIQQQQPEETQRKLPLIATGEKSQTYELKASCIVLWFGQQMVGPTLPNPTLRSRHRIMPQRTANVSKSPPAQMET